MNFTSLNTEEKRREERAAYQSVWVSVIINFFLSSAQIIIGIISFSSALIADGIHSFSDLVGDFIVLIAGKKGAKKADHNHPYGYHRYENMASLSLGIILILVGLVMLYSAFVKIESPESIAMVHRMALYMAILTLVLKEGLFRYMLHMAEKVKSTMLVANAWHARSDAASSLVVGIGILGNLMGYPFLDPLAALIVALIVIRMGWKFAKVSFDDLTDRAADEQTLEDIQRAIQDIEGVKGIHDLHSRKTGDWIVLEVHVDVSDHLTVVEGHQIAKQVRSDVLASFPVLAVTVHIDPIPCTCD